MTRLELLRLWDAEGSLAKVRKVGDRYGGPGRLRQIIYHGDLQHSISVVVAHKIEGGYGELLQIYTLDQIEEC